MSRSNNNNMRQLVERLNNGEVIPDGDLWKYTLPEDDFVLCEYVAKIIVASAGKPGQGILSRLDPDFFKSNDIPFFLNYGLFPVNGKFDFEKAIESLMELMDYLQPFSSLLNDSIYIIFLGFWLYHGDGNYGSEIYSTCRDKLRVLNVNQQLSYYPHVFWGATQKQWDKFIQHKFPTFELPRFDTNIIDYYEVGQKLLKVLAPIYIIKENIKVLYNPIGDYYTILESFKQATHAYGIGPGPGPTPIGSFKDFFDTTNVMIDWTDTTRPANRGLLKVFHEVRELLVKRNEFNPEGLKWFSQTYFVKSLKPNTVTVKVYEKVTRGFILAITPGIIEKVAEETYLPVLKNQQKENMKKIKGVVLGLHGYYPNDVTVRIVMKSLPWERIWIGVGGKREHGKMAKSVEVFTRKFIEYVQKVKMEKKAGRQEVTKRARTSVNAHTTVPADEMVKKLKKLFLIKLT